jgi:catechol 2,3-dioxygenase-like lactoylglutathione lyase family enzyme
VATIEGYNGIRAWWGQNDAEDAVASQDTRNRICTTPSSCNPPPPTPCRSPSSTDPTEGGRLHHDQQARKSRRRVSLSFGAGLKPALTLTSHAGEAITGAPLKLDQLGITHFSLTVPDTEALLHELLAKGVPLGGPRESFTNAQGRVCSFSVYDPDGMIIQFDSELQEG